MIRATLMIIALLGLSACAEEITSPTEITGRYALETVNSKKLPVNRNIGGSTFTVTSGFYEIHEDKTFTHGQTVNYEQDGQTISEADTGSGVWSVEDGLIRFGYANGALPDKATIKGGVLTMPAADRTELTFRRGA